MHQGYQANVNEVHVGNILEAAAQRAPMTRGEFDVFVRPYLAAGYAREVAEAERQYFRH